MTAPMEVNWRKDKTMFKNTIIAISLLTLALVGSTQSAPIGNGPPSQTGGSDLNAPLEADNFSLGSATTLSQVTYWTLQNTPADYAGSTDWGIYSDVAGIWSLWRPSTNSFTPRVSVRIT